MKLLFCTDTDSGTITAFDLDGEEPKSIASIPVGNGPRGAVRFTKDGRGFVANHAGDTISEIDAHSLREVQRIKVGIAPIGVAIVPGDQYALVSNGGDNSISVVDLGDRKEVHQTSVGREPRHLDVTPSGEFAYAPISGADYIGKLTLEGLKKGQPISVREVARIFLGKGTMPYSAAVSPDGRWVIAANNQARHVSVIDTSHDRIAREIDVGVKGARGSAFTPDSKFAFVTIEDTSEIVVINMETGEIENRLPSGPGPRGILFDADTSTLFASAFSRTQASTARAVNSVSAVRLGAVGGFATLRGIRPHVADLSVGAGPCSVSIFRT